MVQLFENGQTSSFVPRAFRRKKALQLSQVIALKFRPYDLSEQTTQSLPSILPSDTLDDFMVKAHRGWELIQMDGRRPLTSRLVHDSNTMTATARLNQRTNGLSGGHS